MLNSSYSYLEKPLKHFSFPVVYLGEAGFSSYTSMKITYCNRLNTEADERISLSSLSQTFELSGNGKTVLLFSLIWGEQIIAFSFKNVIYANM